jgi:4'-phosphopantetheinyl transferase superfamily
VSDRNAAAVASGPTITELEHAGAPLVLQELEVPTPAGEQEPRVLLVDASGAASAGARPAAVQEHALRAWVRRFSAEAEATHSSRSYRLPLALLAWHGAPVGVDVERVERCERAFAEAIQTPRERTLAVSGDRDRHFSSLWSSKEALSKALGDPLAYDPRRLEGPGSWPQGRSGPWRAAPLAVGERHVAWVCWRAC